MRDGSALRKDSGSVRRIVKIAIKKVYQHTTSMDYPTADQRTRELLDQRMALAEWFRKTYGAKDIQSASPYFVGAFDTVAAVANPSSRNVLALALVAIVLISSWLLSMWSGSFGWWVLVIGLGALGIATLVYLWTHVKCELGLKREHRRRIFHFTVMRMRDWSLSPKVKYAMEALSIDENRADFDRVPWGTKRDVRPDDSKGNKTFQQVWFAGNHSDIGGSYPENESRLSDIALEWMVEAATNIEDPILIDNSVLRLYPSPDGIQHDECKIGIKFLTAITGSTWKKKHRIIDDPTFIVHASVTERFNLPAVLQYDVMTLYRPTALRNHKDFKHFPEYVESRREPN